MDSSSFAYSLIALGFVVFLDLMMITSLGLNYKQSRKRYLLMACIAGLIEMGRQVPNVLLSIYPESMFYTMLTIFLQFAASAMLAFALMQIHSRIPKSQLVLLALAGVGFLIGCGLILARDFPQTLGLWYLFNVPLLLITALLVYQAFKSGNARSPSRVFLVLVTSALLVIRVIIPMVQLSEVFFLLYYFEIVLFPMILAALNLTEVELANKRIEALMADQLQSEEDLQFMLDNSMDVILIADQIGLLKSWNRRAEDKFGYNEDQAIGKLHMDELFSDNFWEEGASEDEEFIRKMEHVEGRVFNVGVRIKTVFKQNEVYRIFVLRDLKGD